MEMKPGYIQTNAGLIPNDWDTIPTSDIVDTQAAICYGVVQVGKNTNEGVPIVAIKHVQEIATAPLHRAAAALEAPYARSRVKSGDVLISIKGTIGRVGIVPSGFQGNISRDLARLRPAEKYSSEYIFFQLEADATQARISKAVVGTTRLEFSIAALRQFEIAVPRLPAEQRAIAATLSDVDGLLAGLDRLIAKKRNLKRAAMQQILTGRTRLAGFQGEWKNLDFSDIAIIRNVKVISSSAAAGTQCVELDAIGQGTGQLLGSIDATGSSSKYSFKKGDVLFGRLRAYLRKYWLASFDGICSTEIWPLIPRDERLYAGYLHLLVQTNDFVDAAGVSYGTHMPRSDWSVLSKFRVSLPSVPEQTAIAAVLSDMDTELAALESRRTKTRALKQAMMQELLTGRIRLV